MDKIKTRQDVHGRSRWAYEQAEKWYDKLQHCTEEKGGNILSCKPMIKLLQARGIYIHYCNEFQRNQNIPLIK